MVFNQPKLKSNNITAKYKCTNLNILKHLIQTNIKSKASFEVCGLLQWLTIVKSKQIMSDLDLGHSQKP